MRCSCRCSASTSLGRLLGFWSGVGLALPTDKVTDGTTSQAVRDGVDRVLGNPSFARRAAELGKEYAEYDGIARTVSVITEVAGAGR